MLRPRALPVLLLVLAVALAMVATLATSAEAAVQHYYDNPLSETQKGDEFVPATGILGADGKPLAKFSDGDVVVFYNYRRDRPPEITRASTVSPREKS